MIQPESKETRDWKFAQSLHLQSLRLSAIWYLLAAVALAAALWLPRGLALDRFVTADEHAWLARSGNFYHALARGDWGATFQRHHPGVTITWAGTAGFLATYPEYAADAPGAFGWLTEEIEPFLRAHGHDPVDLLAAGRAFAVLVITAALLAAFVMAVQLVGWPSALVGFGLIAFAPFHIGLSRLLHLDGLLSSFMLLALLAFLVFLQSGRKYTLVISGVAAGLAWLTRSPGLFLVPFVTFVTYLRFTIDDLRRAPSSAGEIVERQSKIVNFLRLTIVLAVWCLIGLLIFVLLWPAMWVDPVGSLVQVVSAAGEYAAEGHLKPTFFNGAVYSGDPGLLFYPLTYLWRTTPITLIGLGLALVALARRDEPLANSARRATVWILLLYALLFGLFMNLGAKKFDRYLLPAYLPLELVAGIGWVAGLRILVSGLSGWNGWNQRFNTAQQPTEKKHKLRIPKSAKSVLYPLSALPVLLQALFALSTFPYFLSYYNPLLGGGARAPEVMMIGWGEGADRAARQLAAQPDATQRTVASAYTNGPFSYFYPGETLPIYFWHAADYAVLYAQDRQRRLPAPRQIAYFEGLEPQHTVRLNGIDYAWTYDLRRVPVPDYVTDWREPGREQPQIRLVSYQFPASVVQPGETLQTILYFVNMAPIDDNLNVIVRLVGVDGTELARSEGWPWGAATSTWQPGEVWPDGHALAIPADAAPGWHRLDVAFHNPGTRELLPARAAATGASLGEFTALDYVEIGAPYSRNAIQPQMRLEPPAVLGQQAQLRGVDFVDAQGDAFDPAGDAVDPGQSLSVALYWQALTHMAVDYTVFVHVMGADGTTLTQQDGQPLGEFYPTSFWQPGRNVVDTVDLSIPPDAAPGAYAVHVGLYELATMQRLPVTRGGDAAGDSVVVGTVVVE